MFGVTINVKGDIYANGASQDKLNSGVSLDYIYTLTGMPEDTLVSKWKESYDELQSILKSLNGESDIVVLEEKIEIVTNLSIKMSLKFNSLYYLAEWLINNSGTLEENIENIKIFRKYEDFRENGEKYLLTDGFSIIDEIRSDMIKSKESLF